MRFAFARFLVKFVHFYAFSFLLDIDSQIIFENFENEAGVKHNEYQLIA